MLRNRHPGTFVYSSLFLFLFFWFFGIDLSALRSHHAEPTTPPVAQSGPVITHEAQNLSFVPNSGVSGELESALPEAITAILPVLPETVDQIPDLLKPFLNPPDTVQLPGKYNQSGSRISHLIVLSPESSLAFVRRELQATFIFLRPALDLDLDISLFPWSLQIPIDESDEISLDVDVALLRAVSHLGLEENTTILLMDQTGLSSLSSFSLFSLVSPTHNFLLGSNTQTTLPFGPYGAKAESYTPVSSTTKWGFSVDLQPAMYLYPPFVISSSIVVSFCDHLLLLETEEQAGDVNGVNANIWPLLGSFVSSFRNDSIGGLKIQPATAADFQEPSSPSTDFPQGVSDLPTKATTAVDFLFIFPTLSDLHHASSLICLLLANSTRPNLLIILYTTLSPPFDIQIEPEDVMWESVVFENDQSCKIPYENLASSSYTAFSTWFLHRLSPSDSAIPIHILFTLKEFTAFFPFIVLRNPNIFNSTTHISIPRSDLAYADWIGSLNIAELKNWHIPHISLSITTRNRPRSLLRLLNSLSSALYFGDLSPPISLDPDSFDSGGNQLISLRINIEQDCDQETLRIVRKFEWPPSRLDPYDVASNLSMDGDTTKTGSETKKGRKQGTKGNLYIHHRIVHGGLLPAVVESWFPKDPLHDYGLLLEDDVEVSPLFYAWVKMCVLKYRYGDRSNKSPYLFGISLYQQKHLELPMHGRKPFNPRSLFSSLSSAGNSDVNPITPYLSQIPCSWGALYFPEHWEEFHSFLAYRLSERSIIPLSTPIVPSVRSNLWLSSWKRFFIELVYLRGYVMLYPNFDGFASLSTNHLEPGAHVKAFPPPLNSPNFVNPNHLNSSYLDLDKEKEKRDLFRLPLMPLPVSSRSPTGTGLLQLPENRLPSLENLPTLNLTGYLISQKELQDQGDQRRKELFGCNSNTSRSAAELYSVLDLFCITDNDVTVSL